MTKEKERSIKKTGSQNFAKNVIAKPFSYSEWDSFKRFINISFKLRVNVFTWEPQFCPK